MKTSERFALMEWLANFPEDKTYAEIMEMMTGDHEWVHPDLDVWEVVENYPLDQVAEFIDMTRKNFVSAVESINGGEV